jgi:hypothetical protein
VKRRRGMPCDHADDWIGTVSAGHPTGRFMSVVTCEACAVKSAGYVQMETGLLANPLLTFEEARRRNS